MSGKITSILEEIAKLPVSTASRVNALRNVKALPEQEIERLARGIEHYPIPAYHGTRSDFDVFEKGDIGYHFGTPEQANKRLRMTRNRFDDISNERVMPVRLNLRNPLRMSDIGEWNDPLQVAIELRDHPGVLRARDDITTILNEAAGLKPQFETRADWLDSGDAQDLLGGLRDVLRSQGFDGIQYRNATENAFGDQPGFTPRAEVLRDTLSKQFGRVQEGIRARRLPLPESATQQERMNHVPFIERRTPQEEARIRQLEGRTGVIERLGRNSPDSYIVFDPSQVRSRFADFSQFMKDEGNIGYSYGGAVAGLPRMR